MKAYIVVLLCYFAEAEKKVVPVLLEDYYGTLKGSESGAGMISGSAVQEAKPGQFPWYLMLSGPTYKCGGNLITNQWVLTAAHCTFGCPEKLADGRIGCLKHPDFSNGVEANIALVKLYKPVKLNDTVKTIRMAEEDDYIGGNVSVVISGFGMDLSKKPKLKYAEMLTITNQECKEIFTPEIIVDTVLCTIPPSSPCFGDGGGGLIRYEKDGTPVVVGVVNFVEPFGCENGAPTGYTRVSSYRRWIREVTGI